MPLSIAPFDAGILQRTQYDAFIASVGFEPRSRYVAEHALPTASKYFASAFADRQTLEFDRNLEFYQKAPFQIETHDATTFQHWIGLKLREVTNGRSPVRVCIDVSSMSRSRMASAISAVVDESVDSDVTVDFVYAIAKYSPPPSSAAPITALEPVGQSFAGWSNTPEKPVVAIVGLGYEPDKVIGAIEYFEPETVWAFVPEGNDPRFLEAVERSNQTLWDDVPVDRRLTYKVLEPCNTFVTLESLCYGLRKSTRPILIPFGPKIFAVLCMLVGAVHPEIGVWRVSGGVSEEPTGRHAQGTLTGLRCTFYRTSYRDEKLAGRERVQLREG